MNLTKKYHRAKWSQFTTEQIEVIARELLKIEANEGAVRVSRVVELSRDPGHPLHEIIYGISDREAAELWRSERVREVCRAVEVHYIDDEGETRYTAPMLVSCRVVSDDEKDAESEERFVERAYRSTEKALADPVTRKELLDEAMRQAESFSVKYQRLSEFSSVCKQLREIVAGARKPRKRTRKAS